MTTPELIIEAHEGARLELRGADRRRLGATLHRTGLTASASVWAEELGLAEFLRQLATDWRGWHGVREWSSMEAELTIEARSSQAGQVVMTVHLRDAQTLAWRVQADLIVDAGQLEALARRAERFEAALASATALG